MFCRNFDFSSGNFIVGLQWNTLQTVARVLAEGYYVNLTHIKIDFFRNPYGFTDFLL